MPIILAEPQNYGLLLNGSDQYGFHDTDLPDVYAISIWMRPTNTITTATSSNTLVATRVTDTSGALWLSEAVTVGAGTAFVVNETFLMSKVNAPGQEWRTAVQSFTFTAGTWYNMVVNWNGSSRYNLIINGTNQSVTSGTSSGHVPILSVSTSLTVGAFRRSTSTPAGYFNGAVANLIVFDTALSGGDISTIANGGPNGPTVINGNEIGAYKFNDGGGSTAVDTSGNGYNLTLVNNPTWL